MICYLSTVQHYYTRITHQPLEKTLNESLSVSVSTYVTAYLVIIQRCYVGLQLRANALGTCSYLSQYG